MQVARRAFRRGYPWLRCRITLLVSAPELELSPLRRISFAHSARTSVGAFFNYFHAIHQCSAACNPLEHLYPALDLPIHLAAEVNGKRFVGVSLEVVANLHVGPGDFYTGFVKAMCLHEVE